MTLPVTCYTYHISVIDGILGGDVRVVIGQRQEAVVLQEDVDDPGELVGVAVLGEGAVLDHVPAQTEGIGQVSVVADRKSAARQLGDDLVVSIWIDGDAALFQTKNQDGDVVIDQGVFRLS